MSRILFSFITLFFTLYCSPSRVLAQPATSCFCLYSQGIASSHRNLTSQVQIAPGSTLFQVIPITLNPVSLFLTPPESRFSLRSVIVGIPLGVSASNSTTTVQFAIYQSAEAEFPGPPLLSRNAEWRWNEPNSFYQVLSEALPWQGFLFEPRRLVWIAIHVTGSVPLPLSLSGVSAPTGVVALLCNGVNSFPPTLNTTNQLESNQCTKAEYYDVHGAMLWDHLRLRIDLCPCPMPEPTGFAATLSCSAIWWPQPRWNVPSSDAVTNASLPSGNSTVAIDGTFTVSGSLTVNTGPGAPSAPITVQLCTYIDANSTLVLSNAEATAADVLLVINSSCVYGTFQEVVITHQQPSACTRTATQSVSSQGLSVIFSTPSGCGSGGKGKGVAPWLIALIVVSAVVGAALILGALLLARRRLGRSHRIFSHTNEDVNQLK